jgi:hypothetical protein
MGPIQDESATADDFFSNILAKPNVTNNGSARHEDQRRKDPRGEHDRHLELLHQLRVGGPEPAT